MCGKAVPVYLGWPDVCPTLMSEDLTIPSTVTISQEYVTGILYTLYIRNKHLTAHY